MKGLIVYVVTQDRNAVVTVRTSPVDKKWLEGPDKTCSQVEAYMYPKTARKIARRVVDRKVG